MTKEGECNMKKVNLISKKIMSAGLAASLLLTSLGNATCFAEPLKATQIQTNQRDFGNHTTNVNVKITNNSAEKSKENTSKKKEVAEKNKSENSLKKALDVTKWGLVSAFLIYAGYKNGKDIVNCSKECWNFILENKESFKEILNGGVTAIKGLGNTAKNTAQLIWKIISFAAKHTEAAKNIMAAVGTYSVYNSLKNKINNFINKENNKSVNSYNFEGCLSKN